MCNYTVQHCAGIEERSDFVHWLPLAAGVGGGETVKIRSRFIAWQGPENEMKLR